MSLGGSTGGPGVEQTDLRERTGATLLSGRPRLSMGCGGEIQMLRAPGPGSEVSSADSRRSPPVPGTDGLTDRPTQGRESCGPVPLILAPDVVPYIPLPLLPSRRPPPPLQLLQPLFTAGRWGREPLHFGDNQGPGRGRGGRARRQSGWCGGRGRGKEGAGELGESLLLRWRRAESRGEGLGCSPTSQCPLSYR